MWTRRFLMFVLLIATALTASALDRPFPDSVKRGKMTPANYPSIIIDGKTRALTAGARIFNEDNLIQMPASLRGSDIVVNYAETDTGEIDRIWILTSEEASQKLPNQTEQNHKPLR